MATGKSASAWARGLALAAFVATLTPLNTQQRSNGVTIEIGQKGRVQIETHYAST